MNIKDVLWLSYKDLREKKVRTALTIMMVVIGVASIVALTSQTAGISASIQKSLSSLGPTSIIVTSSSATGFTSADAARLSSLPNVSTVIPILDGSGTLYANGQNSSVTVLGISEEGLGELVGPINLYQGAMYNDTIAPDALAGYTVAFPTALSGQQNLIVGESATLKVGGGRTATTATIPIVGILNSYGTSIIPVDTAVILPIAAAQIILHKDSYNLILVKASSTSSVTALSALITTIYGSNAHVTTTQQILQTTNSIIGSISLLFAVIAGVSLLVAAIGIMNIMLIAVLERTHEIGIMKSVGFRNSNVMLIFLFQALMIGFLGGVLGIALGAGASYTLAGVLAHSSSASTTPTTSSSSGAQFRSGGSAGFSSAGGASPAAASSTTGGLGSSSLSYSPVFTPSTILAALAVAMIVSIIAGIYPAWRASKMEPIDALRQL